MVMFDCEEHVEERRVLALRTRSPSTLCYFPPLIIPARITYQSRRFLAPKVHIDVELKPRIDSSGRLSYQAEINFKIKRGSKLRIVADAALDSHGLVKSLYTPYANLCVTNAGNRNTVVVEHDGETNPWRIYWDCYDPHHIRIAPLGE